MNRQIKRIEAMLRKYQAAQHSTVFLLEDGSAFVTDQEPMNYLIVNGVETPRGRIAAYPHPVDGVDPLSLSLYELIDEGIQLGGLGYLLDILDEEDEE